MLAEFSFLRHPLEKVMRYGRLLVPGIERIEIVYFDGASKQVIARSLSSAMDAANGLLMDIEALKGEIARQRKKIKQFTWISKKDLPWNPIPYENVNKSMYDEFESMILVVPLQSSEAESLHDLVFLYFNNNLSNLKINASKEIGVEIKDFVGSAYAANIKAIAEASLDDLLVWNDLAPAFLNTSRELELLRKENEELRKKYHERLLASAEHQLKKLAHEHQRTYNFSQGALERIKAFSGENHQLESAIRAAVRIANNFSLDASSQPIEISESFLNFKEINAHADMHDAHLNTKLEKPYNYLEGLEQIVAELYKNNKPVTGKNVAEKMDPPVQPPSITMYLNSHQKDILQLFRFYEDKWPLLRSAFKPTVNLLENSKIRPHQVS